MTNCASFAHTSAETKARCEQWSTLGYINKLTNKSSSWETLYVDHSVVCHRTRAHFGVLLKLRLLYRTKSLQPQLTYSFWMAFTTRDCIGFPKCKLEWRRGCGVYQEFHQFAIYFSSSICKKKKDKQYKKRQVSMRPSFIDTSIITH